MANENISEILNKVPFFSGLTNDQLNLVQNHLKLHDFEPGTIVFEEGDEGDCVYFIVDGILEVLIDSGFDEKLKVAILEAGKSFGEMSIIDELPRSATVQSLTQAIVLSLSKVDFDNLVKSNSEIGVSLLRALARFLCQHLRETNENLSDFLEDA